MSKLPKKSLSALEDVAIKLLLKDPKCFGFNTAMFYQTKQNLLKLGLITYIGNRTYNVNTELLKEYDFNNVVENEIQN